MHAITRPCSIHVAAVHSTTIPCTHNAPAGSRSDCRPSLTGPARSSRRTWTIRAPIHARSVEHTSSVAPVHAVAIAAIAVVHGGVRPATGNGNMEVNREKRLKQRISATCTGLAPPVIHCRGAIATPVRCSGKGARLPSHGNALTLPRTRRLGSYAAAPACDSRKGTGSGCCWRRNLTLRACEAKQRVGAGRT